MSKSAFTAFWGLVKACGHVLKIQTRNSLALTFVGYRIRLCCCGHFGHLDRKGGRDQNKPSCSLLSSQVAAPQTKACILTDMSPTGKVVKMWKGVAVDQINPELVEKAKQHNAFKTLTVTKHRPITCTVTCSNYSVTFLLSNRHKLSIMSFRTFVKIVHTKVQAASHAWPTNNWLARGPSLQKRNSEKLLSEFPCSWSATFV